MGGWFDGSDDRTVIDYSIAWVKKDFAMSFGQFWSTIVNTIRPIRSLFGFYIALYLFPLSLPLLIGYEAHSKLFNDATNDINTGAAIIVALCALVAICWTAFFLIYFTRQRTKNPHLYQEGFLKDVAIKGKPDEHQ